jgi:hypothetical protein
VLSRRRVVVGGTTLLLALAGGRVVRANSTPEAPLIDPEVRTAVARGPAQVLVELRLPEPSASGGDAAGARERAIAAVRQAVVARLSGTSYRVRRQFTTVPLLGLEIGPDALQALEGMGDLVTRVRAEQVRPPATSR